MSWERHQMATLEHREEFGGWHVTGWVHVRHCGCAISVGMRMDDHELTASVKPCPEHGVYVERAYDTMQHMPPQEENIMDLFARLLDAELQPVALKCVDCGRPFVAAGPVDYCPECDAVALDALDAAIERQTGFHPADPRGDGEEG